MTAPGPEAMEALRDVIVDAFPGRDGIERLEDVVRPVVRYSLFAEFGGGTIGMVQMARRLLDREEQEGRVAALVAALLRARPSHEGLRAWTALHAPAQLALVPQAQLPLPPSQQEGMEDVAGGLAQIRRLLGDPAIRDLLARTRIDLDSAAGEVIELAVSKDLHDALHDVQMMLLRPLLDCVRDYPDKADLAADILGYAGKLDGTVTDAQVALDELPEGSPRRGQEQKLVEGLRAVTLGLRDAVAAADPQAARRQAVALKALLRRDSPRLNTMLVQSARRIPITALIDTMGAIAARLDPTPTADVLRKASVALDQLRNEVAHRISEHEAWQQIETHFLLSEDLILSKDSEAQDEFAALWPMLTTQVGALCETPAAAWAADLMNKADAFSRACPLPIQPPVDSAASAAFRHYVTAARTRFYIVDKELKGRCRNVARLSSPLRDLLSHG